MVKIKNKSAIAKEGLPPTANIKQVIKKAIGKAAGTENLANKKSEDVIIIKVDNMFT